MIGLIFLLIDYYRIKRLKGIALSCVLPLAITAICAGFAYSDSFISETQKLFDVSQSALEILFGFSLAAIAIVTSAGNDNIEAAKKEKVGVVSFNKEKTMYDEMVTELVFATLLAAVDLITVIALSVAGWPEDSCSVIVGVVFAACVYMLVRCIFASLSSIIHIYFVLTKDNENRK